MSTYRRILVTGSRTWDDWETIVAALEKLWSPDAVLVHGNARGADRLAAAYWISREGIPPEKHDAKWNEFGRAAGPIRNKHMVSLGADICVAFLRNNSVGTTDCLNQARAAGIPTVIHMYTTKKER